MTGRDNLTRALARDSSTLQGEAIPADVRRLARIALLDLLGVALAGSVEPLSGIMAEECADGGGAPQAVVIGRDIRLPVSEAALANGVAAHALDYDDVSLALSGHPGAAIWPAVLALGERIGAAGSEILTAYVAGYELAGRLGRLMMPSSQALGFHLTGTVGIFGAAAACARLLRLDPGTTATALGIAGAQAAGLRIDGGTMAKPLHAGRAAQGGLLAARLASRGFTARADVIEAERGFEQAFRGGTRGDLSRMEPSNGFHLRDNIFKLHAACFFTHAAMDNAISVRDTGKIAAEDIESVRLLLHPATLSACDNPEPADELQSKRSFPQTVSMAFLGLDTSDPQNYGHEAIRDAAPLRQRVSIETDPGIAETAARMQVRLRDGRTLDAQSDAADPVPMTDEREEKLAQKFLAIASPVIGPAAALSLAAVARDIEAAPDVRGLLALCSTGGTAPAA